MSAEVLTQDEVDALLTGVAGADEPLPAPPPARKDTVRPFDPATQERVVRAPMPALDAVSDRFVRMLRIGLFSFLNRVPEVVATPVRAIKYSDFIAGLPTPANASVVQLQPLRGSALFSFDPALAYLVVDTLFGGDGRFQPQGSDREATPTEERILERMLAIILDELEKAWKDLYALSFRRLRSAPALQLANVAKPDDAVVALTFTIGIGAARGAFHVCIPYAALEPIRALIHGSGEVAEALPEPDLNWLRALSKTVQATEVELVANLVTVPVTVKQLLGIGVGDILSVDIPETITAHVDGVPIFECRFGARNGQYAIRVESVLTPDSDSNAGGSHA